MNLCLWFITICYVGLLYYTICQFHLEVQLVINAKSIIG